MIPTPYFDALAPPSDPKENILWRLRVNDAAEKEEQLQDDIRQACFDDILFFIAYAGWLIEPRDDKAKVIPFLLWPTQVGAIKVLVRSIQAATTEQPIDVIFDKSRGQGATWCCLWVLIWFWLKDPMFAAGIISRNIEAVDKRDDLGALMPKIDWALSFLPPWLLPAGFCSRNGTSQQKDRSQTDHVWRNCELKGTLSGTACTAEAFSGNRLTAVMSDEAAKVDHKVFEEFINSLSHVTNTRWTVSTHFGDSGPFFEAVFDETWQPYGENFSLGGSGVYVNAAGSYKVVLDWRDNPSQNRLVYRYANGRFYAERPEEAEAVDQYVHRLRESGNWTKLLRRGFVKEGQLRSPWYDRKCLPKLATPRTIAQDVDRNPKGTVGKAIDPDLLARMTKRECRPPAWEGDVTVLDGKLMLVQGEGGPLKLWFMPGIRNEPPSGKFVMGADIATGSGGEWASNSCLEAADAATGEQVLEYTNPNIVPAMLARVAVALCEWLHDAYLIWESNGPTGGGFKKEVMQELTYWNVYMREKEDVRTHEKSKTPGWNNNLIQHKQLIFDYISMAMGDGSFVPRSVDLVKELGGWEWKDSKNMIYRGTGHGDRAIAAGMCNLAMREIRVPALDKSENEEDPCKQYCMAGRMARRDAAEKNAKTDILAGFRR